MKLAERTLPPPLAIVAAAGGVETEAAHPWFEPVSWYPRAFVAHNFASKEETDHMIKLAQPQACWVSQHHRPLCTAD